MEENRTEKEVEVRRPFDEANEGDLVTCALNGQGEISSIVTGRDEGDEIVVQFRNFHFFSHYDREGKFYYNNSFSIQMLFPGHVKLEVRVVKDEKEEDSNE